MDKYKKEIELFIISVKEAVPNITKIDYKHDIESDEYFILHNLTPTEELKYEDIFGNLIYKHFFKHNIYNISFGHNPELSID